MSVTGDTDDPIPHGLRGYRTPWNCRCDVCRTANTDYNRERRKARRAEQDELAAKRAARKGQLAVNRQGGKAATESGDSVPKAGGPMERAVIEETKDLERARERPTMVIAARNLAKIVDNPKLSSIHTSTTKQIMTIMADLRGDTEAKKLTGKRKSGSRLATVGNLTKVKRAQ